MDFVANAIKRMSGVKNDFTPTPTAQINNTMNTMIFSLDLSTTTHLLQYLRAYYTQRAYYEYCVMNDETSATVLAKGNLYLGKLSCLSLTLFQTNTSPPTTAVNVRSSYMRLTGAKPSQMYLTYKTWLLALF